MEKRKKENKKDDLLEKLEMLMKVNEELTKKVESLENKNNIENKVTIPNKKKSVFDLYKDIEPTRRVFLVNMLCAGGTYKTVDGKAPIRFDGFGSIQSLRFEDLQYMITRYRKRFESLELRILDEDVVEALNLTSFYNKYNVTEDDLMNMINLSTPNLVAKIQELPRSLQETALRLIIEGVAKNQSEYMDRNKWDALNTAFNIDIEKFARNCVF